MSDYNELLAKLDRIDAITSGGLCSFHPQNWRECLVRIQNVIESKSAQVTDAKPDKDKARELAIEALIKLNVAKMTIYSTLSLSNPESVENFAKLGDMLLDAYNKGRTLQKERG